MELTIFQALIGRCVTEIELVQPISWWFRFTAGGAIRADTLWRLVHSEKIQATSDDQGHQFGLPKPVDSGNEALRIVGGSPVKNVRVAAATGDLWIEFDNNSRLEILATSTSYESWSVFLPNGDEIIGVGGGDVHVLRRDQ